MKNLLVVLAIVVVVIFVGFGVYGAILDYTLTDLSQYCTTEYTTKVAECKVTGMEMAKEKAKSALILLFVVTTIITILVINRFDKL